MASIRSRRRKDGTFGHTITWREGGTRSGSQESETFDDESAANEFKATVEAAGQHWPAGWVKGRGYVTDDADKPVVFRDFAAKHIRLLTGIQEDTREDYTRTVANHMGRFAGLDIRDPQAITSDLISEWVLALQALGRRPKTIRNIHGLLYAIMQGAVEADPPIRGTNPCARTRLPRIDDREHDEDWDGDEDGEMTFLTGEEFVVLHSHMKEDAKDMTTLLIGTGLRWGEITALQVRDIDLLGAKTLRVARAWKHKRGGGRRLGPPKSKASRRTISLTAGQLQLLSRHVAGKRQKEFVFTGPGGDAWKYSTYRYRRWEPAVRAMLRCEHHRAEDRKNRTKSMEPCGCLGTVEKKPRIHDLRHSHVSHLIAANMPLPAIQHRLGHESITTTSDRYGHLMPELHGRMLAAVDVALAGLPVWTDVPDVAAVPRAELGADVQ